MAKNTRTLREFLTELQQLKGEMMTDDSPGIIKSVAEGFIASGVDEQLASTDLSVIASTITRMMWSIRGAKDYRASHQRAIGRLRRWATEEKGLEVPDIPV